MSCYGMYFNLGVIGNGLGSLQIPNAKWAPSCESGAHLWLNVHVYSDGFDMQAFIVSYKYALQSSALEI